MRLIRRQALFELTDGQQVVPLDNSTELPDQADMLGDVASQFLKLWVLFHEALHIRERLHGFRIVDGLRARLVGLDVGG